jgi:hypothetical protein
MRIDYVDGRFVCIDTITNYGWYQSTTNEVYYVIGERGWTLYPIKDGDNFKYDKWAHGPRDVADTFYTIKNKQHVIN